jgi:hypothetical protein
MGVGKWRKHGWSIYDSDIRALYTTIVALGSPKWDIHELHVDVDGRAVAWAECLNTTVHLFALHLAVYHSKNAKNGERRISNLQPSTTVIGLSYHKDFIKRSLRGWYETHHTRSAPFVLGVTAKSISRLQTEMRRYWKKRRSRHCPSRCDHRKSVPYHQG